MVRSPWIRHVIYGGACHGIWEWAYHMIQSIVISVYCPRDRHHPLQPCLPYIGDPRHSLKPSVSFSPAAKLNNALHDVFLYQDVHMSE